MPTTSDNEKCYTHGLTVVKLVAVTSGKTVFNINHMLTT